MLLIVLAFLCALAIGGTFLWFYFDLSVKNLFAPKSVKATIVPTAIQETTMSISSDIAVITEDAKKALAGFDAYVAAEVAKAVATVKADFATELASANSTITELKDTVNSLLAKLNPPA